MREPRFYKKIREIVVRELGVPADGVEIQELFGSISVNLPNERNTMTLSSEERRDLEAKLRAAVPGRKIDLV